MRGKLTAKLLTSLFMAVLVPIIGAGPVKALESGDHPDGDFEGLQEVSFSLNRLPENHSRYSLAISDTDERSISGTFSIDQLEILRAIMAEAEKFALTEEAVGTKEQPITTRFKDKQESAFIVDVQKDSTQSRLFITLSTELGRVTWEAGAITRNIRRREGFFFDLLSRLESALPKLPAHPSK